MVLLTKNGMGIRFSSTDVGATSRATIGIKGMNFKADDEIVVAMPVRHKEDDLAIFSSVGTGKRFPVSELPTQNRGGKGLICHKASAVSGTIAAAALISDEDNLLICGDKSSICINAVEVPSMGRIALGNQLIKANTLLSVSKV